MKQTQTIANDQFPAFLKTQAPLYQSSLGKVFMGLLILAFSTLVGVGGYSLTQSMNSDFQSLIQFLLAVLFSLSILIIVHESVHALLTYLSGARKIFVQLHVKKFLFYVGARDFTFSGHQITLIAISPFAILSIALLVLLVYLPAYSIFILTVITIHTLLCEGDFTLINYVHVAGKNHIQFRSGSDADTTEILKSQ